MSTNTSYGEQSTINVDIKKIQQSAFAVVVNDYSIQTGVIYKNRDILDNPIYWHKFLVNYNKEVEFNCVKYCKVQNAQEYGRDFILKTILDHVQPLDLVPAYFTREKQTSYFLGRRCGPVIEKLCKDNLLIENPKDKQKPFKLNIILRFATTNEVKFDASKNITKVLKKRFNPSKSILNLENFYQDSDLLEFCILSQPKLMSFVLHLARSLKPETIVLSNNEIRTLAPLEAISNMNVTCIDLRNNLIMNMSELESLQRLNITELWLEGNPLCGDYDEFTYVQNIKKYCPKIEKLDGIVIKSNGFPPFRRNFLCNHSGYDLINQFLEHYFTSFDSKNRTTLKALYHEDALFSLTADYHPMQLSSLKAQLRKYKTYSRNLLALADISRNDNNLFRGNEAITNLLNSLPPSEHDPYSFTVDMIHYTVQCAVVVVTGVFRELPEHLLDAERMLGFNRCFILNEINGEYCIVNEQMHIFNALTSQEAEAFEHDIPLRTQALPPASTPKQKTQMINAMKLITNLTTEWAKKCLEECQYDLKNAITLFIDLYKVDKIPADGFQN